MNSPKTEKKLLTDQQKAELFIKAYNDLCTKHGYQVQTNPAFKMRDDGTWSIVLQSGVGRLANEA